MGPITSGSRFWWYNTNQKVDNLDQIALLFLYCEHASLKSEGQDWSLTGVNYLGFDEVSKGSKLCRYQRSCEIGVAIWWDSSVCDGTETENRIGASKDSQMLR